MSTEIVGARGRRWTYQERVPNDPRGCPSTSVGTDVEKGADAFARADLRKDEIGRAHRPVVSTKRHRDRHVGIAGCGGKGHGE